MQGNGEARIRRFCAHYNRIVLFSVPRDGNRGMENAIFRP